MARLNEAPLPTESVDALKRRFVRQNRELAKNNSAQCLRIRTLECEVSRLLAENLDLREDIVHLQAQLSEPRSQIDNSALVSVKDQLQAKLLEFGALVSELGHIQNTHSSVLRDKSTDPSSWRPDVPAAILSGQAPRMDGIAEEVCSPGGSLHVNRANIIRLSDHSNPSPDIGPPPVVHFDNEDPIKFDPLPTEPDQSNDSDHQEPSNSDNETPSTNLSVNLETRRRRKDSKIQLRRSSLLPTDLGDDEQPQLIKTSAKRKLSVRDVEDDSENRIIKDDFKFSRRSSTAADFKNTEPVAASTNMLEDSEAPSLLPERKVLGNKSVNVSPRKLSRNTKGKGDVKGEDAPLKPAVKSTDRRRSKNQSAKSVTIATGEPETIMRTIEIALPSELPSEAEDVAPKTPLPEFFSPTPSEPSAARNEGRDTPPPSGLKSMSSGPAALNGASRPSRRARAAVNYAEPNLVSKMRRPTATMANAVDANGRRISSNITTSEKKTMRTVVITGEDMTGSLTRNMGFEAPSPLGQKVDREHERTFETSRTASASGRAISALMAGSKKSEKEAGDDAGVYELKDSSDVEESAKSKKRNSRRHSSVTENSESDMSRQRSSNSTEQQNEAEAEEERHEEAGVQETVRKAPRSARVDRSGARRRSMMV